MCEQCDKLKAEVAYLESRVDELEGELEVEPEPYVDWGDLD